MWDEHSLRLRSGQALSVALLTKRLKASTVLLYYFVSHLYQLLCLELVSNDYQR